MVTSDNKLRIFEAFQIDNSLPKHSTNLIPVQLDDSIPMSSIGVDPNGTVFTVNGGWSTQVSGVVWNSDGDTDLDVKKNSGFFSKIFGGIIKKKRDKKLTMTVLQFFSTLAHSLSELKSLTDIAIHYETLINNAKAAGQTALVESLKRRLESAKAEAQLVAYGVNKFLSEEQIVDFYKKTNKDKALKLTWMNNFIKPIPSKILDVKKMVDEKLIFDNYVILHYDPNNDATDLTNSEKEEIEKRKKDPILFGVISGSRRLYYIGDWVDDYCNLTLDVVIEELGEKVFELNNDNVKTFLDRGQRIDTRVKPTPLKTAKKKK